MKQMTQNQWVYIGGGVLVAIIVGATVLVLGIGKAYQKGLINYETETSQEMTTREKKTIKKITVQKTGEDNCIEITPDGIVRTYSVCNERLSDANRLTDLKNIFKLFKLVSEKDLSSYKNKIDKAYKITIETDKGTETYYLIDDGSNNVGSEILDTVDDVIKDTPHPNPSSSVSPFSSSSWISNPFPSASSGNNNSSPQPSSDGTSQPGETFSCGFTESGNKKPIAVSNVICSTEPSPIP